MVLGVVSSFKCFVVYLKQQTQETTLNYMTVFDSFNRGNGSDELRCLS